jgi:putative oxidoreductase
MDKLKLGLRLLLGLAYFVFGLNGFFQFLPAPPLADAAGAFAGAMAATGYFFPMIKATEVVGGFLLLSGMFVPLALILLAPVTLNIFLFHFFLAPAGMYIQVLMLIIHLVLGLVFYRKAYKSLLTAK